LLWIKSQANLLTVLWIACFQMGVSMCVYVCVLINHKEMISYVGSQKRNFQNYWFINLKCRSSDIQNAWVQTIPPQHTSQTCFGLLILKISPTSKTVKNRLIATHRNLRTMPNTLTSISKCYYYKCIANLWIMKFACSQSSIWNKWEENQQNFQIHGKTHYRVWIKFKIPWNFLCTLLQLLLTNQCSSSTQYLSL
jgi:hypothetical protein